MNKETSRRLKVNAQKAFAQVQVEVIKRARQTGTPVVSWRDGKVCKLTPDEARDMANGTSNKS